MRNPQEREHRHGGSKGEGMHLEYLRLARVRVVDCYIGNPHGGPGYCDLTISGGQVKRLTEPLASPVTHIGLLQDCSDKTKSSV